MVETEFTIKPRLYVLNEEEISYFIDRSMCILESIGVKVMHPEALSLLRSAGASLENDSIVRIPRDMVREAITSVPKDLTIFDREGKPVMKLGGGNTGGQNTYYGTGSDLLNSYDQNSNELRLTVSEDIANMAKVSDHLSDIDFIMSYGIPSDVPLNKVYQNEFFQMVTNTTKPIVFTSDNGEVSKKIIKMAAEVVNGIDNLKEKPFIINYSQPTSPLQHSEDALGKMMTCAEYSIPVVYSPGMIPGATGPVTLAGSIAQSLAEALSGLLIHQLKSKGAPIILCGAHGSMDMRYSINAYASPERLKTEAALSSIYQRYGIPTWGFGGCTDANILDQQAGTEFGIMSLWASLCGINLAHDTGYMGSGMIGDLKAIVMNDEINRYVRHVLRRGIEVNEENIAYDVIKNTGPGGNYLFEEHTHDKFRTELFFPKLFNRKNLSMWKEDGSKDLLSILDHKVKQILKDHNPAKLDDSLLDKLKEMVND